MNNIEKILLKRPVLFCWCDFKDLPSLRVLYYRQSLARQLLLHVMGFNRAGSPLQSRVAKACRNSLRNLKNQFRPKKHKVEVIQRGNNGNTSQGT